ncbi:hypothetical protein [Amycolatopsis sp. YIM 10]|uniref:hypothetical protein n=1 Tax=Amycolatopsis sp. YIM 10 TaxID=2653857 RepID=UPI0012906501|nr:hypothetical protein [Amycolatopsis sp. YIM 10]
MSTIRKLITGSAAVLALGLAGGLAAPAVAAATPAGQAAVLSSAGVCDKYLKKAKDYEAEAQKQLALAKKAAAAGDKKRAEYHKKQAEQAQYSAKLAYDQYNKCRT